mgnify:CR=1 FL=1
MTLPEPPVIVTPVVPEVRFPMVSALCLALKVAQSAADNKPGCPLVAVWMLIVNPVPTTAPVPPPIVTPVVEVVAFPSDRAACLELKVVQSAEESNPGCEPLAV